MREVRRRCYDDGFRRDALELIKAGAGKDTHDNDTEFARHARSRDKLGMDTCFVYPCSSWRRENNGNRNGVAFLTRHRGVEIGRSVWYISIDTRHLLARSIHMITVAAGVKAMPAYVPPKDGKPRNQVDAKWMKLAKASSRKNRRGRAQCVSE